jgi:hypothetical protein
MPAHAYAQTHSPHRSDDRNRSSICFRAVAYVALDVAHGSRQTQNLVVCGSRDVTKNEASGAGGGCPLRRALEGRDPTPHEPWPALPRESPRQRVPRTLRSGVEPGDTTPTALGTAAPVKEPRLRSGGRANQHPDFSTTASGAGGKTGFAAPTVRLRAGAGSKDPSPSGRPGLQRPEDPSSAAPRFRRDPGAAGSPEAPEGASTARV